MTDSCTHLARFGMPTESRFLTEFRDSYDWLVFNANSLAHMPGAIARLVSDRSVKPYIVDPQTHAFQHDPIHVMNHNDDGTWSLKRSIARLADAYGPLIQSKAGKHAVVPSDLSPDVIENLARGVVEFQLHTVRNQEVCEENRDYLEWMKLDVTKPRAVIAPYFYMDARTYGLWLDPNMRLAAAARAAVRELEGTDLYLELVIDRDILLDEGVLREIASVYSEADCDGILLWVDALSEQKAPGGVLTGLLTLLREFRSNDLPVMNLYGGYFSILLSCASFGSLLSGVCHGMEYGEDRSVVPVGGGIPMAKFYLPSLHQRLRFGDVARLLFNRGWLRDGETFHREVCSCQACRDTLRGDASRFSLFGEGKPVTFMRGGSTVTLNYPLTETKERCLRHYLWRKEDEYQSAASKSRDDLLDELETTATEFESDLGVEGVSHLRTWVRVLREVDPAR